MQKRTMAIFALACTESLRNKGVQANQKPSTKKRQHVNKNATQANGGDGHRAAGQAADHHGIHDRHAHPAELGENERDRQPQSGADLGAECVESNHCRKTGANECKRGEEKEQTGGDGVTSSAYWTLSPIDQPSKHS